MQSSLTYVPHLFRFGHPKVVVIVARRRVNTSVKREYVIDGRKKRRKQQWEFNGEERFDDQTSDASWKESAGCARDAFTMGSNHYFCWFFASDFPLLIRFRWIFRLFIRFDLARIRIVAGFSGGKAGQVASWYDVPGIEWTSIILRWIEPRAASGQSNRRQLLHSNTIQSGFYFEPIAHSSPNSEHDSIFSVSLPRNNNLGKMLKMHSICN